VRRLPPGAVLLWGVPTDRVLAQVADALLRLGVPTVTIDQRTVHETTVELESGYPVKGCVRCGALTVDLTELRAAYIRPYDSRQLPDLRDEPAGSPLITHAQAVDELLTAWADVTPLLVANRPSAMAGNNSKPFQAAQATAAGFAVPDTLLTTDPEAVNQFWGKHGEVVYKSISGVRSIVRLLEEQHKTRFDHLATCPTQFQRRIRGTNYRVHVVGQQVFTCRITSTKVDYRYDSDDGRTIESCTLPGDIAARAIALAELADLSIAGLDLMEGVDGRWYCFEANPSPGFTFFQRYTRQPIDRAIAELLCAGQAAVADGAGGRRQHRPDFQPVCEGLGGDDKPRRYREQGRDEAGQIGGLTSNPVSAQSLTSRLA
jgi:hypothetical protein